MLGGACKHKQPVPTDVPSHRRSSDISVDCAVGNAIAKQERSVFETLSEQGRRMLFWNLKNVEYALGANISDLSMKFCKFCRFESDSRACAWVKRLIYGVFIFRGH